MRYPVLALLAQAPAHGYELKRSLDGQFGDVWPPINVGQIYTTLSRLERDGLVQGRDVSQSGAPNKRDYEVTDEGRALLEAWVHDASATPRLRDEFFLKLAMAKVAGVGDPMDLIERQRRRYLQALRDLENAASRSDGESDGMADLLVEGASLHLQADLKWLDACEQYFSNGGVSWTKS